MTQHPTNEHRSNRPLARASMLATASAVALLCSAPLQAQADPQPAQTPAGPTGAAQNQQGAVPGSAATPQSSAESVSAIALSHKKPDTSFTIAAPYSTANFAVTA